MKKLQQTFRAPAPYYSDGYKVGHKKMLAPGTKRLYGTWIPRSIKYAPKGINKIVSFGQQLVVRWLHSEWQENFFDMPIDVALKFGRDMSSYLGLEYDADHFKELHKLEYLPVKIKSLPEGIETEPGIPHMTFVNTVDGYAWLTLYLETSVSSLAWKPSTSATIALQYRRNLYNWIMKTDPSNLWLIDYLAHDFSARGLSPWDMLSSGLGHATAFRGSDSIICIPAARYFYDEAEDSVCINSVNASEHSVSTTKIFTVGEQQMLVDWMETFPKGILSVVADTFDLWKLITEYLPNIKVQIMLRDGKLVVRPDSGDPVEIICGTQIISIEAEDFETFKNEVYEILREAVINDTPHGKCGVSSLTKLFSCNGVIYRVTYSPDWNRYDKQYYFIDDYQSIEENLTIEQVELTPQEKGVIQLLWEIFGGTVNEQGFKILDSHIGAIYGDSITLERQEQIYERLADKGFATTNIVLGVGSFTYQMNTRDTLGFAAKGAWFCTEDAEYDIYKDPVTDDGTKKSLKGRVAVIETEDGLKVLTQCTEAEENTGLLATIYEDGKFSNQTSLSEIRERIKSIQ